MARTAKGGAVQRDGQWYARITLTREPKKAGRSPRVEELVTHPKGKPITAAYARSYAETRQGAYNAGTWTPASAAPAADALRPAPGVGGGELEQPWLAPVLLDAVMGQIHINPHKDLVDKVLEREELHKDIDTLKTMVQKNPKTKDNVKLHLFANINLLGDIKAATEFNAEGVGLYRTEFPFIMRSNFPTEEEQFH